MADLEYTPHHAVLPQKTSLKKPYFKFKDKYGNASKIYVYPRTLVLSHALVVREWMLSVYTPSKETE